MSRVVVVHGISNTFITGPQLAQTWGPALRGGVELAGGARGILTTDDIGYVAYGDIFRPSGRFLGGDGPPLTADDVDDGLETELLLAWWKRAAEIDPGVPPPDGRTLGARASSRAALLALAGSRFLARVAERTLVWWLKQVSTYFTDAETRQAIQKRFAEAIDADTRVVVAHSLGSVLAYEGLCTRQHPNVTDLVTLGSPLGVPHVVLHRLRPQPSSGAGAPLGVWPGVSRWVNINDDGDFVALQPRLRAVFGERVVDVAISNGVSGHAAERYLSAAETGAAVLAGLR